MLKDSPFNRIFIRSSIFLLRAVAPLSLGYCGLRLAGLIPTPNRPWIRLVDIYAASESFFYLGVYLPRKWWLNRPAAPYLPLSSPEARRTTFLRLWKSTPDPQQYLSLWFAGAPIEALCREDVKDWLLWNMWNKRGRSLVDEDELDEYLAHTEKTLSHSFSDGRSGNVSTAVTFEPVRMMHRPLFWYLFLVGGVDSQLFVCMKWYGYRFYRLPLVKFFSSFPLRPFSLLTTHRSPSSQLSYWHLPHTSKDHAPILFLHAIGIGLQFYLSFLKEIRQLNKETGIGIICLEIPSISSRISPAFPHGKQLTRDVKQILERHNWPRCMLISHSHGSVSSTHLLRDPETAAMIGPLLFVDPVAFAFHDPNIAWNFLRRKPKTASQYQLQYFASTDPDVAYTLTRKFVWPENSLWREDVEEWTRADPTRKCTVSLSGKDIVADTSTMGRYLTRDTSKDSQEKWYEQEDRFSVEWKEKAWTDDNPLEVLWFPDLNHAEVFDDAKDRARLMEVIKKYTKTGVSTAVS